MSGEVNQTGGDPSRNAGHSPGGDEWFHPEARRGISAKESGFSEDQGRRGKTHYVDLPDLAHREKKADLFSVDRLTVTTPVCNASFARPASSRNSYHTWGTASAFLSRSLRILASGWKTERELPEFRPIFC